MTATTIDHRGHRQVDGDADPEVLGQHAEAGARSGCRCCTSRGRSASRPAQRLLVGGAGDVHRHVAGAEAEAEDDQTGDTTTANEASAAPRPTTTRPAAAVSERYADHRTYAEAADQNAGRGEAEDGAAGDREDQPAHLGRSTRRGRPARPGCGRPRRPGRTRRRAKTTNMALRQRRASGVAVVWSEPRQARGGHGSEPRCGSMTLSASVRPHFCTIVHKLCTYVQASTVEDLALFA